MGKKIDRTIVAKTWFLRLSDIYIYTGVYCTIFLYFRVYLKIFTVQSRVFLSGKMVYAVEVVGVGAPDEVSWIERR